MSDDRPILIILHQESSTPGRVGQKLRERGFELDIRRPPLGDSLPATLDDHAGAVMFGGPMSAYDDEPFIKAETDWIDVPLREGRPFLGLCLGAQIMARHLGAAVKPDEQGRVEVGYYPIQPTPEGAAMLDWPEMVYQWHRDGFDLPDGAVRLAGADGPFPEQAFRVGHSAYGLQFHPEVTFSMLYRWTVKGAARMASPGAQCRNTQVMGRLRYDAAVDTWLDAFLDQWLADPASSQVAAE